MANNKVQLANGTVLIDLTDTTAVASDVAQGKYFYTAGGVKTAGTASGGGVPGTPAWVWEDTDGYLHLSYTYPGSESTMVSETLVFVADAAVVGTAIVGVSRTG